MASVPTDVGTPRSSNVILVGEIRDEETAGMACRAAQVGRMVLSTLHTNSAEGAVTRLRDLGVPGFVVGDVLRGVLAQTLVPVGCGTCGGSGCRSCGGSGIAGRRVEAELWEGRGRTGFGRGGGTRPDSLRVAFFRFRTSTGPT